MADHTTTTIAVRGCNIKLMRGGSGPPLLFLHGASGAGAWLPFMQSLAARFDVIVPAASGLQRLAIRRTGSIPSTTSPISISTSWSSSISTASIWSARRSAAGSPPSLRCATPIGSSSLTLVGAAGIHVPGVKQVDLFLGSDEQRIRDFFYDQACADEMIARILQPEFEDANMKNRIATAKLAWQPRAYDPHLRKWLHRIDVPTLIVWGANDRVFPMEYAYAWQQADPRREGGHHSRMRAHPAGGEA